MSSRCVSPRAVGRPRGAAANAAAAPSVTVKRMTTIRTKCASVAWFLDVLSITFALGHLTAGVVERIQSTTVKWGASYELLESSAGRPSAWDCRNLIRVVVNLDDAPRVDRDSIERDLHEAIDDVNDNGPFTMEIIGHTHAFPTLDWPTDRLDEPGSPHVIVHVGHTSALAGNRQGIAALGGSFSRSAPGPFDEAHAGYVFADLDRLGDYRPGSGWMSRQALFSHELLHVLGLGHVSHAESVLTPLLSQSHGHIGAGDRAGLIRLAAGRCP